MRNIGQKIVGGFLLLLLISWIGFNSFVSPLNTGNGKLIYLDQPGTGDEKLIITDLEDWQSILLDNFGTLLEMKPSPDARWLAMITAAEDGTQTFQLFSLKNKRIHQSFPCEFSICNALFWQADSKKVYFHLSSLNDPGETGSKDQILSLDVKNGLAVPLSFKEGTAPLSFSLSPNGKYQAFYDKNRKGFYVLENWSKALVLIESQDASSVLWQQNPARISVITSENMEKIPVSHLVEVNLETLSRRYLKDPSITNMDYSNLIQHPVEELLIFGCRPVLRTMSRQVCMASLTGFSVEQRTDLPYRNHTAAVISQNGKLLAYQTLDMSSSTVKPAVWVMDWATSSSTLVAENAAMPQWIP